MESTDLANMASRAKLISGDFNLKTAPGTGTKVVIIVPFDITKFTNNES